MAESNCNPPLNYGIPKDDWEHVFALSRKYSLLTIYQMFMDVHPESKNFGKNDILYLADAFRTRIKCIFDFTVKWFHLRRRQLARVFCLVRIRHPNFSSLQLI